MSSESATSCLSCKGTVNSYLKLDERRRASGQATSVSVGDSEQRCQIPVDEGSKCQLEVNKESKLVKLKYRTRNFDPMLEFSPVSWSRSLINFLNTIVGTTVLALPYAMKEIGLSAPFVMAFAAFCVNLSMVFMLDSLYEDGDRSKKQLRFYFWHASAASFGEYGKIALANYERGGYIMWSGMFLVVAANAMNSVVEIGSDTWILIFSTIIIFECVLCTDLNWLTWVSSIGILNTLVCCGVLIVVSVDQIPDEPSLWISFNSYTFFNVKGFFSVFNTFVLAFSAGSVLPRIYIEMEEKLRANSMLRWGYSVAFVGKLLFMVTIFYTYQEQTEDIAILNVTNSAIRTVLAVCIAVDKLVTIPIYVYANKCELHAFVQSIVMEKFKQNRLARCTVNITECVIILFPSVLLTKFFPNFWEFAVLAGCIVNTPLTIIFPNIQWYLLTENKPIWKQLLALGIALLGAVTMICGLTYIKE